MRQKTFFFDKFRAKILFLKNISTPNQSPIIDKRGEILVRKEINLFEN